MACNPAIRGNELMDVLSDETGITEIEIAPNGRLYLFGASLEVLTLLQEIGLIDASARVRLANAPPSTSPESSAG
jgi:hypothetical protein